MKPDVDTRKNRTSFIILLVLISLIGFILRVICCNWGSPLQLHPDEHTIVDNAIDMLRRHSWEANVYNRPDHFEIKCVSILFALFSRIRYHMAAYKAFEAHKMAFYWIGRFYTTLFGTAMIPLAAIFIGKILPDAKEKNRKIAQTVAALLISFSCLFIEHSAYATPDVVLAFLVLLFALLILQYESSNNVKFAYFSAIIIGVGITVKYTTAIMCAPLALVVVYKSIVRKNAKSILSIGFICAAIVCLTAFFIAPNLFTNYQKTYTTFIQEARPNHLGADGLGFFGNLLFYIKELMKDQGWLSLLFVGVAMVYMCIHRDQRWLSLTVGLFFWVCTSVLSLHWQRWGMPIYILYIVVVAIGVASCLEFAACFRVKNKKRARYLKGSEKVIMCGVGVWIFSILISGLCLTVDRTLPDTRNVSLSYVNESGILSSETLSEGYTPFYPANKGPCVSSFLLNNAGVKPTIMYAAKKYLIISDDFKNRYLKEQERYPQECAVYEYIDQQYSKEYQTDGTQEKYSRDLGKGIIKNIIDSVSYLTREKKYSGEIITIYNLAPTTVSMKNNLTGLYLCPENDDEGAKLGLSENPYKWVMYENDNKTVSLISYISNYAISICTEENALDELIVSDISDSEHQQWTLFETAGGASAFVFSGNYALSIIDNAVCLTEYKEGINQLWAIEDMRA